MILVEREKKPNRTYNVPGLYANVFRPAGVTEKSKLPVVVVSTHPIMIDGVVVPETFTHQWFFGGAFAVGDGSSYDGSTVIQRSVQLGEPVIYVNFNYRLNAFGWLAGKEALAGGAANNGLYDREYHID
jgi:acetylcholinesterase